MIELEKTSIFACSFPLFLVRHKEIEVLTWDVLVKVVAFVTDLKAVVRFGAVIDFKKVGRRDQTRSVLVEGGVE